MPPDPERGPGDDHERLLAAEAAASRYWRSVAADRREEAARVQHRPLVRAAIALDRRSRKAQDLFSGVWARVRGATGALAAATVQGLEGSAGATPADTAPLELSFEVVTTGQDVGRETLDAAVERSTADVVVVVAPDVTLAPGAARALVAALSVDGVVAAVPQSVFPTGSRSLHAGRLRSAGAQVDLVDDAPISRPLGNRGADPVPVDLAVGGAVAIRRADWIGFGGSGPIAEVTAAIVDLGIRATTDGGVVVAVPGANVVEADRPRRRVDIAQRPAADSGQWSSLVRLHGPTLRRMAAVHAGSGGPPAGWSVTLTTATPSRKIAAHSGDWHYAGLFEKALARAGIDVLRQPISEAASHPGRSRDVHIVLRGLEPVERCPGQVHVLWVISHPEALDRQECDRADLILVASSRYAEHLSRLTTTPVEVFEQATDPSVFTSSASGGARRNLTVVANTRGVRRSAVDAAIAAGYRPMIHGLGWDGLVDPSLIASDYVAFEDLPGLYASSDVVLNDHWETMRLWGFVSNRVLDATAAGAAVISDHMPEIAESFGDLVPTWRTVDDLARLLADQRHDPDAWRERASRARLVVVGSHTFDHRVAELDTMLRRHGLHPAPEAAPGPSAEGAVP